MKTSSRLLLSFAVALLAQSSLAASPDSFRELRFFKIRSAGDRSVTVKSDEPSTSQSAPPTLYWLTPTQLVPVKPHKIHKTEVEYRWQVGAKPDFEPNLPGVLLETGTAPRLIRKAPAPLPVSRPKWLKTILAKSHEGEKFEISRGKVRPAGEPSPCTTRSWEDFTWLTCEKTIHLFHRDERLAISNTGSPSSDASDHAPRLRFLLTFHIGPQKYYVLEKRTATGDDFSTPVVLMKRVGNRWFTHEVLDLGGAEAR
jgi:hypothetical protein